jgi:AcrR family transcriptional regulator
MTNRRTHAERRAESAQRLLTACVELIAEQGFERTTAVEIGERAGYSRSMVSVRYGSKEGLLHSLFDSEIKRRLLPDSDLTGLDWVLGHLDHAIALVQQDRDLVKAFCVLIFEGVGAIPSVRQWYARWMIDYEAALLQHLEEARSSGQVDRAIVPADEAEQMVSYGLGICFRWTMDSENYDFAEALRTWRDRLARTYAPV